MTQQLSFSKTEREYMHLLRDRVSRSEDTVDLENMFSNTVNGFLNNILKDRGIQPLPEDVTLSEETVHHYRISSKLRRSGEFMKIWGQSDLPEILTRFADIAHHRHLHLAGHPEKTVKKIRYNGKKMT